LLSKYRVVFVELIAAEAEHAETENDTSAEKSPDNISDPGELDDDKQLKLF